MEHHFITTSHDLMDLFANVKTMGGLIKKISNQSLINTDRYDSNTYKGDAFEFFVELFLHINSTDNRVGVYNYKPIPSNTDRGADGVGENMRGEKCVAQIKFRDNTGSVLTTNEDNLGNLVLYGMGIGISYDLENTNNYRHFVFTTAKGLHYFTDNEMFLNRVKCFAIDDFKLMVDGNTHFWNKCRSIIGELLKNEK
jgi:hypothetical protein